MRSAFHRTSVVVLALAMLASAGVAAAQDASPEAGSSLLDGLGLPVLEVTVTGDGVVAPAEVAAGPVLFVAHNEMEGAATVDVLQLPEGVTLDDYMALNDGEGVLPEWTADVVVAGYVLAPPRGSASIVLNLAAGDWSVAVGESELEIAEPETTLTVSGEATEATIATDLDLEMGEYVFTFPDTLAAGPQIWHVTNSHTIPHHAVVFPVDRLYSADEVAEGIMAEFGGTPVADGFSFDASVMGPPVEVPVLTGGQEIWMEANLEPGFYVAVCFISDPGDDTPHAMRGMIDSFEVTAEG